MTPYPLLFRPILVPRVWGGRSLESLGKVLPPGEDIGESWEVADLPQSVPNGRSIIANGEWAGRSLREAVSQDGDLIMGDAKPFAGGFPLLIKYLDARENLSVQVHPDAAYAAKHPDAHFKSEAWVIVKAAPGSVLYKGVRPDVTRNQFSDHIRTGQVVNDLIAVPARAGDCYYLPSGTCHALGAGIVVAEIQTPSDTTFRIYDWGRPPEQGRPLHIEQALECIQFGRPHKPDKPHIPIETDALRITPMCDTECFSVERIDALKDADLAIITNGLPEVWMMMIGRARIQTPGVPNVDLSAGMTTLLPAELGVARAHLARGSALLRVRLPSPLRGMIA